MLMQLKKSINLKSVIGLYPVRATLNDGKTNFRELCNLLEKQLEADRCLKAENDLLNSVKGRGLVVAEPKKPLGSLPGIYRQRLITGKGSYGTQRAHQHPQD